MPNDELTHAELQPTEPPNGIGTYPVYGTELNNVIMAAIDRAVPALERIARALEQSAATTNGLDGALASVAESFGHLVEQSKRDAHRQGLIRTRADAARRPAKRKATKRRGRRRA